MERKARQTKKTPTRKKAAPGKRAQKRDGYQQFKPTDEHRVIISALIESGSTVDQIAQNIVNPRTRKPIGLETLYKHFSEELEAKGERFKTKALSVVARAMEKIDSEPTVALRAAMFTLNAKYGFAKQSAVSPGDIVPDAVKNLKPEQLSRLSENLAAMADQRAKELSKNGSPRKS